jgi:hypothetical protein
MISVSFLCTFPTDEECYWKMVPEYLSGEAIYDVILWMLQQFYVLNYEYGNYINK